MSPYFVVLTVSFYSRAPGFHATSLNEQLHGRSSRSDKWSSAESQMLKLCQQSAETWRTFHFGNEVSQTCSKGKDRPAGSSGRSPGSDAAKRLHFMPSCFAAHRAPPLGR